MVEPDFSGIKPISDTPDSDIKPNFAGIKPIAEQGFDPVEAAKAAAEGFVDVPTFGTATRAELALGISTPEAISKRKENYGGSRLAGGLAGTYALGAAAAAAAPIAGPIAGVLGIASKIGGAAEGAASALGAGELLSTGARFGAEAGLYSLGDSNAEAALGNQDFLSQKTGADLIANIVTGGALGVTGARWFPKAFLPETEGAFAKAAQAEGQKIADAKATTTEQPPPGTISDQPGGGVKPSTVSEMEKKVSDVKNYSGQGYSTDLPQKQSLVEADKWLNENLHVEFPAHEVQLESMNDEMSRDDYKRDLAMQGRLGDALRNWESMSKQEGVKYTNHAIESLSPEEKPTSNAEEGGHRVNEAFEKKYKEEQAEAAPVFEKLKSVEAPAKGSDHLPGIFDSWLKRIPGIADLFEKTEDGSYKLKSYHSSTEIDRSTYRAISDTLKFLEKSKNVGIKELVNIRRRLDQHYDKLASGEGPNQIRQLKAGMMDYIQKNVDALPAFQGEGPVREAFKKYAINEAQRLVIEKKFGASVGKAEYGAITRVKPEQILDNMFSDTATTDAARTILGEKEFKKALANYMAKTVEKHTTDGRFNSQPFGKFLKNKQPVLDHAFAGEEKAYNTIKHFNTKMRILPDSASIVQGSGKTILGLLKAHSIPDFLHNIKDYVNEARISSAKENAFNTVLSGKAEQQTVISKMRAEAAKATARIDKAVTSILSSKAGRAGLPYAMSQVGSAISSLGDFDKKAEKIREMANNPEVLIKSISDQTEAIHKYVPQVTQGMQATAAKGIQYLNSKLPPPQQPGPFNEKTQASAHEIARFNRSWQAVHNPIAVLGRVKNGTLTREDTEALTAVHPALYDSMKQKLIQGLVNHKNPKQLPYDIKASISAFMGHAVVKSLQPQSIMANQNAYAAFQQQKQQEQAKVSKGAKLGISSRYSNQYKLPD